MPVPYDPKAVANYFLLKPKPRGGALTQMKLHKLLYYAHGWHLGLRDEPLLNEMIEAWEYGPVVPSIYQEFKALGANPIDRLATDVDFQSLTFDIEPEINASDSKTIALLDRVWKVYGNFTAAQLSQMTHEPDSPWARTRAKYPNIKGVDIPNDLIRDYFKQRLEANRHAG